MKKKLILLTLLMALTVGFFVYRHSYARPHLTIMGYVRMADGLGKQTVELIDAFKDELSIGFIPTHKNRMQDVPDSVKGVIKNKKRPLGKVILFEDCLWWPTHHPYQKFRTPVSDDQIRIAYSMFESSAIPPEWTTILNTYFDAVAVPDPFLVSVYKECGVNLPIFVLPLGLDLSPYLEQPLKTSAHTPFTFANLSTCVDRKNQLTLLRAFAQAFGSDPNYRLLLNCRATFNGLDKQIEQEIETLGLTNVDFSIRSLSKQEYLDLFKQVDCYINLSKGEGFSIQPREAMALGIPTIVTDNTAQSTLCASGLATAVPSTLAEPALYDWGSTYGNNFNCSVDDAAASMRHMVDNYATHLAKSAQAREWVRQYQYANLKPLYRSLIKPHKIILGKENKVTKDALITNSLDLYKKYQRL